MVGGARLHLPTLASPGAPDSARPSPLARLGGGRGGAKSGHGLGKKRVKPVDEAQGIRVPLARRGDRAFGTQLFLDVTAQNVDTRDTTRRLLHFGQRIRFDSRSPIDIITANFFPHFLQANS